MPDEVNNLMEINGVSTILSVDAKEVANRISNSQQNIDVDVKMKSNAELITEKEMTTAQNVTRNNKESFNPADSSPPKHSPIRRPVCRPVLSPVLRPVSRPTRRRTVISDDEDEDKSQSSKPAAKMSSDASDDSDDSSSSSDTSSSESSSESDGSDTSAKHVTVGGKRIRVQGKAKAKAKSVKKSPRSPVSKRVKKEASSSEQTDDDESGNVVQSRAGSRSDTDKLIAKILCRWWYVLPPWPPADFDWDAVLKERKLKLVPIEEWEGADDVDENGFTKVYPISHYEGVYRDPQGTAIDLRPLEGRPCYSSFKSKSVLELNELLVTALRNQMEELKKSPYGITEQETLSRMQKGLAMELKDAEDLLARERRYKLDPKINGIIKEN